MEHSKELENYIKGYYACEFASYSCATILAVQAYDNEYQHLVRLFLDCSRQCRITSLLLKRHGYHINKVKEKCFDLCKSCYEICINSKAAELKSRADIFKWVMQECQ